MRFPKIDSLQQVQDAVANTPEIIFSAQGNGITIGCYMFCSSKTFQSPESLECRGIAFDSTGAVVSRPLHKFFNIGEKESTSLERVLEQEIHAIYHKIDGSMICTAWVDGHLQLRSKKSFTSDVVNLAWEIVNGNANLRKFMEFIASDNKTAIFELTHPKSRIVVAYSEPKLTLLHVRCNITGDYLLTDSRGSAISNQALILDIPEVERCYEPLDEVLKSLEGMTNQEGYVIQFKGGDMVKVKCPWYIRLHRSITFLRERDIALLFLHEELDDTKADLVEAGILLDDVNRIEERIKNRLIEINTTVTDICVLDGHLSRKDFAIKNSGEEFFGLIMGMYLGKDIEIARWYERTLLQKEFSLVQMATTSMQVEDL